MRGKGNEIGVEAAGVRPAGPVALQLLTNLFLRARLNRRLNVVFFRQLSLALTLSLSLSHTLSGTRLTRLAAYQRAIAKPINI